MRIAILFVLIIALTGTGCSSPLSTPEAKQAFEEKYKRATRVECLSSGIKILPILCSLSAGFEDSAVNDILISLGHKELELRSWDDDSGPPVLSYTYFKTSEVGVEAGVDISYADKQLDGAKIEMRSASNSEAMIAYEKLLEYVLCSFEASGQVEKQDYIGMHFHCTPAISIFLNESYVTVDIFYGGQNGSRFIENLLEADELRRELRIWEEQQKVRDE